MQKKYSRMAQTTSKGLRRKSPIISDDPLLKRKLLLHGVLGAHDSLSMVSTFSPQQILFC